MNDCALPSVSVIVPVYNAERDAAGLIESLLEQDYPRELTEIIIIDNNSNDKTLEVISKFSVKILKENDIQSSYAARNKGIENACGEVLAFTDSDCIAEKGWLSGGIRQMVESDADLAGGNVVFYFSRDKTPAEIYDSLTNMQNEKNIRDRKVAKTANLFVKAEVFKNIGCFPSEVKSGGDVQWTSLASEKGFRLVYASDAIVRHPARKLSELIKKQKRVGVGLADIMISQNRNYFSRLHAGLGYLKPPRLKSIIKQAEERHGSFSVSAKISLWLTVYLLRLINARALIFSFLR